MLVADKPTCGVVSRREGSSPSLPSTSSPHQYTNLDNPPPAFLLISGELDPSAAAASPQRPLTVVHGGDAIAATVAPHWKMGRGREDTMVVGREKRRLGSVGRPRGRRWEQWRDRRTFVLISLTSFSAFFSIQFRAVKDGVVTICTYAGGWWGRREV